MAYDIMRRRTSPQNWSRGSGQNIGTVGAAFGGEGLSKKLVVGALVGAAGAIGYLAWRSHRPRERATHQHPMAQTIFMHTSKSGRMQPVSRSVAWR